ncbi:uncharacterized protein LOC144098112 [Amblyomma americanum]
MEPAEQAATTKHKSKKTSRRSHKRHGTPSSTSSRLSTADEESSQAKPTPGGIRDATVSSTSAISAQLFPAPVMTAAAETPIPDADAAVPSASAASVQLSATPDGTPATKTPPPITAMFDGVCQPTAYTSDENALVVEEPVVVPSPFSLEIAYEDVNAAPDKDLEQRQEGPGEELTGPMTPAPPSAEGTRTAGEEPMAGRLIRSWRSDRTLPMSGAEEALRAGYQDGGPNERMTRRLSTIRRFRDVGRSLRSSFSSSMALSPATWAGSNLFLRRYSEQQRLRATTAKEGPTGAPHDRDALCRKVALSLMLRAVIGMLIVTAMIVVLKMLIPTPPAPDVCRSHSCLEYSERLRRSLNLSVDPCDSLEGFVCPGWNDQNILSKHLNLLETALARLSRLTRSVSRAAARPQSAEQRGAALYRSCDTVLRGEREELLSVRSALDEAHVLWPGRTTTQRQKPDALHTLLFAALRLGWEAILRVDIRGGSKVSNGNAASHTVMLTPSREFGMLARKYVSQQATPAARRAYFDLLSRELGGADASAATTFDAVQRLDADFLLPLASTVGEQRSRGTEAVQGSELFAGWRALEDRWRDAMAGYGIRGGHRVLLRTEDGDFVRMFFALWEAKGEEKTHLFVSWCTIQVAALFASRRLVAGFYGCDRHGPIVQGLHCLARAYRLSGYSLFAGYNAELFRGDARAHADALVRAVRGEFRKTLTDQDKNGTLVADWTATDVVFRAIDVTSSEKSDNGSEVDAGYPDMGDSLVDNWRRVAEAQPAAMFSREVASVVSAVESLSLYAVVERDFTLLPYAFSFPLYDEDAARAISYAGLGSQVQHRRAEERIRGLCMWGKKEAVNGELIVTCDSKGDVVYKLRSI